ncbi:MAG TPA: asparaginase domain-containing protein [Candidatus Acidoferrales bacterium]|nr:asparaginase domain-containing protein [Candidatus Acidoferrales bacterium]
MASTKPRIAIFSGPTATIQNSEPLVTSNKAREKYGLPPRLDPDGSQPRFDALRLQRLAAPVTVYVEQFSAHPLERDAAELYGPPDGYMGRDGVFRKERREPADTPVYEITLRPEDGLYPLPYMARQANGEPWEGDAAYPLAPAHLCRQPFYPDASRIFEEIDRMGIGHQGSGNMLSAKAEFDFFRPAPSGGYKSGLPEARRTDTGEGDIAPETLGKDFFIYRPAHIRQSPSMRQLARITNAVQAVAGSGRYAGAIWLEGSPNVEESIYWLNLLIDTASPIVGNASQRPHGSLGNDGDLNIVQSVQYLVSRAWADDNGRDEIGNVVIQEKQIFTARDVQKADARPGGYVATGGHGGIIGSMGNSGPVALSFKPVKRHTHKSAVNITRLPEMVQGVRRIDGKVSLIPVSIKDAQGQLLETAIPKVTIAKTARYLSESQEADPETEIEISARMEKNLRDFPLSGFVAEGVSPYGNLMESLAAAMKRAALSGMPVVRVGRGNAEGFTKPPSATELIISGNNLTATKARLLLMACLMKFGSLPPAADPSHPTENELKAIKAKLAEYQEVFDTH